MTKSKEVILREAREQALSLDSKFNFERERMFIAQIIQNDKSGKLQKCTWYSFGSSIVTAAELGVTFNPERGHATLVPYGQRASFTLMYPGMAHLASRELGLRDVDAGVVYSNDQLEITLGTDGSVRHTPNLMGERGSLVGSWAYGKFPDGSTKVTWVSAAELKAMQENSKTTAAWSAWPDSMRKAKAMRRLLKTLLELRPGSAIERALEQSEQMQHEAEGSVEEDAQAEQEDAPEVDVSQEPRQGLAADQEQGPGMNDVSEEARQDQTSQTQGSNDSNPNDRPDGDDDIPF